eukprot:jgi/Ulvmu1/6307/UM029_0014.1
MHECDSTTARVEDGALALVHDSGDRETVRSCCLQRSALLQDILATSEGREDVKIPICIESLTAWVKHIDRASTDAESPSTGRRRSDDQAELGNPQTHINHLLQLLMAADVLIDQQTLSSVAKELAAALQSCTDPDTLSALVQKAAASLPEHLLLASLRHLPLPHCLAQLPPTIHAQALRAHHPSIDASHSLTLHHLPLSSTQPALAATATLTCLRDFSCAGLTLPRNPSPALHPISSLLALTFLSLSDTGLSEAGAGALAAVLPAMRLLASLDLSGNGLTARAMQLLAPAFAECPSLARLNLLNTLPFSHAGADSIGALAASMPALGSLTSLSVGGRGSMKVQDVDADWANPPHTLLRSLGGLTHLQDLAIDHDAYIRSSDARAAAAALAALTQLRTLRCTVPRVTAWEEECFFEAGWVDDCEERAAWRDLAAALGTLTQLTALQLKFAVTDELSDAVRPLSPWLLAAGRLAQLQCLVLADMSGHAEVSNSLCEALPQLQGLTRFEVRGEWSVCSGLVGVAAVVCALPSLRALHMPVSTAHTKAACRDALLAATHLDDLTTEMHVVVNGITPLDVTPWLPLAAAAERLSCLVSVGDEQLRPLVPVIAGHGVLRALQVAAYVSPQHGVLRGVLHAAAKPASIRSFELALWDDEVNDGGGSMPAVPETLRQFVNPGVTALALAGTPSRDAQPPVTCESGVAMTALRSLQCMCVADAHDVCMPALPQLALHTLVIHQVCGNELPLLRELLGHLRHLRLLHIWDTAPLARLAVADQLRDSVMAMPACDHAICGGLDMKQRTVRNTA